MGFEYLEQASETIEGRAVEVYRLRVGGEPRVRRAGAPTARPDLRRDGLFGLARSAGGLTCDCAAMALRQWSFCPDREGHMFST